jgi:hypothetical protein
VSETPVPDPAVQIAREALVKLAVLERHGGLASRVAVSALADAGWLHDPNNVGALVRENIAQADVVTAARKLDKAIGQWAGIALSSEVAKAWCELEDALDATPEVSE